MRLQGIGDLRSSEPNAVRSGGDGDDGSAWVSEEERTRATTNNRRRRSARGNARIEVVGPQVGGAGQRRLGRRRRGPDEPFISPQRPEENV